MQYFSACYTKEQAKAEYRRLVKIHHPDLGGDVQTMQEINAQYDAFQAYGNRWQAPQPQQRTYQPQPQPKPKKPRKPRKKSSTMKQSRSSNGWKQQAKNMDLPKRRL